MEEQKESKFEAWAVIDLFGHTRLAGKVTEETIAGVGFIRVDVPQVGDIPAFTKYLGGQAIYAISPCSEQFARIAAEEMRAVPYRVWSPRIIALAGIPDEFVDPDEDPEDDDDLDDDDDEE